MSCRIAGLLFLGCLSAAIQAQTSPQTPSQTELGPRTAPKTSGKQAVPPEEDKSFLKEEHTFNPLQSEKSVQVGDFYYKQGKHLKAVYRYQDATLWNENNGEAWLKLGRAEEKIKDFAAAKEAYTKYLAIDPDAKDAAEIRKKVAKLK